MCHECFFKMSNEKAATNIVGIWETSQSRCFQMESVNNLLRYDADIFAAFGVNAALVLVL